VSHNFGESEIARKNVGDVRNGRHSQKVKTQRSASSQHKKSEKAVTQVIAAICSFTNPWRTENKERLYSLASDALVPKDAEDDILLAESKGRQQKEKFIQEKLTHSSEKDFFEKISRHKLKTMEAGNKPVKIQS